jgi:hypothetical protein
VRHCARQHAHLSVTGTLLPPPIHPPTHAHPHTPMRPHHRHGVQVLSKLTAKLTVLGMGPVTARERDLLWAFLYPLSLDKVLREQVFPGATPQRWAQLQSAIDLGLLVQYPAQLVAQPVGVWCIAPRTISNELLRAGAPGMTAGEVAQLDAYMSTVTGVAVPHRGEGEGELPERTPSDLPGVDGLLAWVQGLGSRVVHSIRGCLGGEQ